VNLTVAKVGGLQSQGVKGDAVVGYREPLATQNLESPGFHGGPLSRGPKDRYRGARRASNMAKSTPSLDLTRNDVREMRPLLEYSYNNSNLTTLCFVVYATLRLSEVSDVYPGRI